MTEAPKPILYAKVGETPDWHKIVVLELRGGKETELHDVQEVDVMGCWCIRIARDDKGQPMTDGENLLTYKSYGFYRLEEREPVLPPEDGYNSYLYGDIV
jgi:hypothetical protein